jgi:hypothetical protein
MVQIAAPKAAPSAGRGRGRSMAIRLHPLMLLGFMWLQGCEARHATRSETVVPLATSDSLRQPALPPRLSAADTLAPFPVLGAQIDSLRGLPVAVIDGQPYRVRTQAAPDLRQRLLPQDSVSQALRAEGVGYEARFTVQLLGPDGRPRFTSVLRKKDFEAAVGRQLLAESAPDRPRFCAYLPQFRALAFQLWFAAAGTDWAESALFLLDARTGQLREVVYDGLAEDDYAGNALTPDGRALLTRSAILHADGPRSNLQREGLSIPAVQLLGDSSALVVYDEQPNPKVDSVFGRKPHAAYLIDLIGRRLARIPFSSSATGYLDGATLNYRYLHPAQMHYFYDEGHQQLLLVPRRRPTAYRLLPLMKLAEFRPPRQPHEVRIDLSPNIGGSLGLYVDTLSQALRYQLTESTAVE